MIKPEDILAQFDPECYHGEVYSDYAFPYDTVIRAMEKYGEEVLKIAAEKAEIIKSINFGYEIIDKESILNCLK